MLDRNTGIVATLGPSTDEPGVLDALIEAGMDCARLNCSHTSARNLRRWTADVRAAEERAGRPIALMFDLQGRKIRLAADVKTGIVQAGELITFSRADQGSSSGRVGVEYAGFPQLVTMQSEIAIGDGVPRLVVVSIGRDEVVARVVKAGELGPRKGVNVTYARPDLPALTEKDLRDVALGAELGADILALSYVRSAANMAELDECSAALGWHPRKAAKVEDEEGDDELDEILRVTDIVIIARGDYGVNMGIAKVPVMQWGTITRATKAGVEVHTATQVLESMRKASEPTRAEATDAENAVWAGTSALWLSAETATGDYPVESVQWMAEFIRTAESRPELFRPVAPDRGNWPAAAVMHAAVQLAREVKAAALIVPTARGDSPRECAKYRGQVPIIALADDPQIGEPMARQLTLAWGVYPTTMPPSRSADELIDQALVRAKEFAGLPRGARVVITASRRPGVHGATSLIVVREIP